MHQQVKDRLEAKLVKTCLYLSGEKDAKRKMMKGYNEIIDMGQKRVDALANAISSEDIMCLQDVFDDIEIEDLSNVKSKTNDADLVASVH